MEQSEREREGGKKEVAGQSKREKNGNEIEREKEREKKNQIQAVN